MPDRVVGIFRDGSEIFSINFIGALFEIERDAGLWRKRFGLFVRRVFEGLIDAVIVVAIDERRIILGFVFDLRLEQGTQ